MKIQTKLFFSKNILSTSRYVNCEGELETCRNIIFLNLQYLLMFVVFRQHAPLLATLPLTWPLFIDRVNLPQGCRATTKRKFTFNH